MTTISSIWYTLRTARAYLRRSFYFNLCCSCICCCWWHYL